VPKSRTLYHNHLLLSVYHQCYLLLRPMVIVTQRIMSPPLRREVSRGYISHPHNLREHIPALKLSPLYLLLLPILAPRRFPLTATPCQNQLQLKNLLKLATAVTSVSITCQ
jgi:hypothetical protein